MTAFAKVFAPLSIAILVVLSALPWGLPAESRFVLPLLPAVAIHYWVLRGKADTVPEWFVFLVGLLLDILTNGPLGFWSLIYLLTYVTAALSAPFCHGGPVQRWAMMFAAMLLVTSLAWAASSLYSLQIADWQPFAWGATTAAIAHPLLAFLFRAVDSSPPRRSNVLFERGS
jgi:rod shape-determining protein MreD